MAKRRALAARIGLAGAGILFGLLMAETGVRVAHLEPPPMWRFDRSVGWTYRPGLRTWYSTPEFKSWVEINSTGLHDIEHQYAKSPDVFRVMTLGDSFTGAIEVPVDASYSRLLERGLQNRRPSWKVEVINAGIGGYSTTNELLLFRREGARYHPDLVVLELNDADIRDNHPTIIPAENVVPGAPYFDLVDGALVERHYPNTSLATVQRFVGQFRLARLAYRVVISRGRHRPGGGAVSAINAADAAAASPLMASLYRDPRASHWDRAIKITETLLTTLDREVRAARGRLAVVLLFSPPNGTAFSAVEKEFDAFFNAAGIPHFWLSRALREHERLTQRQWRFPRDGHFTPYGHQVAAAFIETFLDGQGLLPRASTTQSL